MRRAIGTAALILAAPAVAADAGEDILIVGRQDAPLTTVTATGSRLGLTPLETPAAVYALDGDAIRARGVPSIVEAVAQAPGIANAGNLGNGGTALSARGFSGQGSVLQLVDGLRLFPAAGTITFPTDPWMVGRIEVLSGPASVLYGQGALGGAVNVVPRRPDPARTTIEAEVGGGTQATAHAAAGIGGPAGDRLGYRLDASVRRSDGYVERGGSRSLALSATARWAAADTLTITLRDDFGRQRPMRYFGTPVADGRIDRAITRRNYNVADARVAFRDNRTTVQADWLPGDGLSLSNIVYRLTSDRAWRNLESYCRIAATGPCADADGPAGAIRRSDNLGIGHDQRQWGDQGSLRFARTLGDGVEAALVAGFDVNRVDLTYAHNFDSAPRMDVVPATGFIPGRFGDEVGIAPRYRTRTDEWALFAEHRLVFGEHLSIVGGLRHERDRVRRWSIADGAARFAFDRRLRNTTWRLGGVYRPRPTLSLYAQYATGVDPLGTLTTYSAAQLPFTNATGDQVEAGVKAVFLNGRGTATVAAYRIVKRHLLAQRTPASPIEQIGRRSSHGVEAAVALEAAHGLAIEANGSLLDARFDDFRSDGIDYRGRTPPGVPERTANLWLRLDATPRLQARAGLRHVGRSFSDNANAYRVPAYTVVDATASWVIRPGLALDVRLYNITDRAYAVSAYGDGQWVLGRPRAFDIALRAALAR